MADKEMTPQETFGCLFILLAIAALFIGLVFVVAPGALIVYGIEAAAGLRLGRGQIWTFAILGSISYAIALAVAAVLGLKWHGYRPADPSEASRPAVVAMITAAGYLLTCITIAVIGLILHFGFLVEFPRDMFLRLVYSRETLDQDEALRADDGALPASQPATQPR